MNTTGKILKVLQFFLAATGLLVTNSTLLGQGASSGRKQQNQGSAPPFSLKIEAPRHSFKVGEKLVVQITYSSTSDHMIIVPATPRDSSFDVQDVHGNKPPLLNSPPVVNSRRDLPRMNGRGLTLGPGESVTENDDVGTIFDMSLPGKYTIQALHLWQERRNMSDPPENVWVKSNTITITITQ